MQTAITKLTAFFQKRANWNFLLLALVVGGLPFVLRLHIEKRPPESWEFKAFPYPKGNFDIFHYYKGIVLIILSFFMVVLLPKKKLRLVLKYRVLLVAFAFLILISSIFSPFRGYSLLGGAESYQGVFVWIAYLLLIASSFSIECLDKIKLLMKVIIIVAVVISLIGILEFINFDVRSYFERVIFHSGVKMDSKGLGIGGLHSIGYNSNYYGVFMLANCITVYFVYLMQVESLSKKIILVLSYCLVCFNLVASGTRAVNLTFVVLIIGMELFLFWKNRKIFVKSITLVVITFLIILVVLKTRGENSRLNNIETRGLKNSQLKCIVPKEKGIKIVSFGRPVLNIKIDEANRMMFSTSRGMKLRVKRVNSDTLGFIDSRFDFIKFYFSKSESFKLINLVYDNDKEFPIVADKKGFFIHEKGKLLPIKNAPKVDFLNRRNSLVSGRGMLWAQSLPLFKNVLMFGYGADCFPLAYPNDDYVSRIKTFGMINASFCTSAHSMYTQIGIEFGVLALVLFILLLLLYFFDSLKLLFKLSFTQPVELICLCCFVVVLGYAVTGITNAAMLSSIINFWVFLGIGIGVNAKIKHQSINQKTN